MAVLAIATREAVLEAARHRFSKRRMIEWFSQPNSDLEGDTPLGALDRGDYDEIINALWLSEHPSVGPAS